MKKWGRGIFLERFTVNEWAGCHNWPELLVQIYQVQGNKQKETYRPLEKNNSAIEWK